MPSPDPILTLDTSVLICGLLSRYGNSGLLLAAFFGDRLKIIHTADILAEYADVMARDHFKIEQGERIAVMMKLRASGLRITPTPVPTTIDWPDKDDIPFIAAALATENKIVVTLNPRDFEPAKTLGLRILSPAQAMALLQP